MPKLASIEEAQRARKGLASRSRVMAATLASLTAALGVYVYATMIRMPGVSYAGLFEPLTAHEREVETSLRADVAALDRIGDRSLPAQPGLALAADFVAKSFEAMGLPPSRQTYEVEGRTCDNVEAEVKGASSRLVIVGAHYDSVHGTVGADDNASGVAAMLALARAFAGKKPDKTLRFVAFANEEPPYFQTPSMGSVVYAKRSRARGEAIEAMLSLETMGYYTDRPKSQHYPFPFGLFYPTVGDFVGFVGDRSSADLVRKSVQSFRLAARFPSEGVAGPMSVPGIGWSDHWSFAREGYPAVMVTDTAPFRYRHYHEKTDTPAELTYPSMARVVVALERVIDDLSR